MKLLITLVLFSFSLNLYSQLNDSIRKAKRDRHISYYSAHSSYLFVETERNEIGFRDTVYFQFKHDSIRIMLPVNSSLGFAKLYGQVNETDSLMASIDGDLGQFMKIVLRKSEFTAFRIEYSGCHSGSTIYLVEQE